MGGGGRLHGRHAAVRGPEQIPRRFQLKAGARGRPRTTVYFAGGYQITRLLTAAPLSPKRRAAEGVLVDDVADRQRPDPGARTPTTDFYDVESILRRLTRTEHRRRSQARWECTEDILQLEDPQTAHAPRLEATRFVLFFCARG